MAISLENVNLDLGGIPETMLWPLWNRAAEQERSNRLIDDPLSAELVDRIDYDFRGMFGAPSVFHVIRARVGDDLIADYISNCEGEPLVICLGDGIDTQAWRIADPRVRWISVDLPEAIAARRRLLPPHHRSRTIECSALDPAWLSDIPHGACPFISAAGLLMYFEEREVMCLLATIADWLPDATIYFDTIPPFFSKKTMRGFNVTRKYTAPPMPWGIEVDNIAEFLDQIPGVRAHKVMTYADPYPERTRFYSWLARFSSLRPLAGGLVVAETYAKTAEGYRG